MSADDEQSVDPAISRVSDAIVGTQPEQPIRNRLRRIKLRLFIDVSRWRLIAGLAAGIYLATILVGVFGPASVQQYLFDGTSIPATYGGQKTAIITVITIVLAINQLVLSPSFGPVGKQEQRLNDMLSHRQAVEENADILSSPTAPPQFLRAITDGTREHLITLEKATTDSDAEGLRRDLMECIADIRDEIGPVSHALEDQEFGQIGLIAVAIHFDTNQHIHEVRRLRRTYEQELTDAQSQALETLLTGLKQFEVAREYFRTRYLQVEFIRFSNAILYTGLPALAIAHYAVGIIEPDVIVGATFGIKNLLWVEAGTFAITLIPVLVLISYMARIVTLAKTSIFIGPFSARESPS